MSGTRSTTSPELDDLVVLYGGDSSEREISDSSGRALIEAYATREGPRLHAVEIVQDGRWLVGEESLAACDAVRMLPPRAVYFLGLHGGAGEDGRLQALLELCGRRFTGSATAASALCMDKHLTRLALADVGVRTAPGRLVRRASSSPSLAALEPLCEHGAFVKPNRGGSSVDMRLVESHAELPAALEVVLASGDDALVEARVQGTEATCAVLGNRGDRLRALPVVEIRPRAARFFDYREKYDAEGADEICPPDSLDTASCERLAEIALLAHRIAGCDGYSRTDFIVPTEDGEPPVVLEVNTLPGLTPRSLLPLAAAQAGMDFRALCDEILRLALER